MQFPGVAHAFRVLAIASHDGGLAFRARRERYPEKLPAVAVGNFGQFLPSQAQPVVPCLTHAVARGEITLIELVAFDNLCERGFN